MATTSPASIITLMVALRDTSTKVQTDKF